MLITETTRKPSMTMTLQKSYHTHTAYCGWLSPGYVMGGVRGDVIGPHQLQQQQQITRVKYWRRLHGYRAAAVSAALPGWSRVHGSRETDDGTLQRSTAEASTFSLAGSNQFGRSTSRCPTRSAHIPLRCQATNPRGFKDPPYQTEDTNDRLRYIAYFSTDCATVSFATVCDSILACLSIYLERSSELGYLKTSTSHSLYF